MTNNSGEARKLQCIRAGHGYYTFLVDHYTDLLHTVGPVLQNSHQYDFVWRGMENPQWQLTSSITRSLRGMRTPKKDFGTIATGAAIHHLIEFLLSLRGLSILEKEHFGLFSFLEKESLNPPSTFWEVIQRMTVNDRLLLYEILSLGQHFGLLTPFLDWTTVPAVALFFAFESIGDRPKGVGRRVVYALNKTLIEEFCPPNETPVHDSLVFLSSMARDNPRIIGQAGLFSFAPTSTTVEGWLADNIDFSESRPLLIRFLIRNTDRQRCLEDLNALNVNLRTVFPDNIGASAHANFHLSRNIAEINKSHSKK